MCCEGGYTLTLRIKLACILPGMQRQSHGQNRLVRRRRRCVFCDWYRRMALHQNDDPERAGWLDF